MYLTLHQFRVPPPLPNPVSSAAYYPNHPPSVHTDASSPHQGQPSHYAGMPPFGSHYSAPPLGQTMPPTYVSPPWPLPNSVHIAPSSGPSHPSDAPSSHHGDQSGLSASTHSSSTHHVAPPPTIDPSMAALIAHIMASNQQNAQAMQMLAISNNPRGPRVPFPTWDGSKVNLPLFLARIESYKSDPFFAPVTN